MLKEKDPQITRFNHLIDVYDIKREKIGTFPVFREKSENVLLPKFIYENLKFIEDRNFDKHFGISTRGIFRALLTNIRQKKISQGGSTITQQLVRTLFSFKYRYPRKIMELFISPILTLVWGREKILEKYVHKVFFGKNIHGVHAASYLFFRKAASHLSSIEALILFSYLSRPNYWIRHPLALSRKIATLVELKKDSKISFHQIHRLTQKASKNASRVITNIEWFPKAHSYIANLCHHSNSLYLSINKELQKRIFCKLRESSANCAYAIVDCKKFEFKCIVDLLDQPSSYATLFSKRISVGSLLKPFLAILATRQGIDLNEKFFESKPLEIKFEGYPLWRIKNYNSRYVGKISLADAIALSDNCACVQALKLLGFRNFCDLLIELEIIPKGSKITPSIILGSNKNGIDFLNLIKVYAQIAAVRNFEGNIFLSQEKIKIRLKKLDEFISVRRVLKRVVTHGTCQLFKYTSVIGAKTGTDGIYKTVIFFDHTDLYISIHKEKERIIFREQYLEEVYKSYGVVSFAKEIYIEAKRQIKSVIKPKDVYGDERWVS